MDKHTRARLTAQANVLKALAHPSRLFVVKELSLGERCVCELTEMIGADVSTVSRHLTVLRNAGIVTDEKRGNQIFCSLKVPCILQFLSCVESVLETNVREQLELRKIS